jgi:aryl-alcohol dehydrogenase-like predicted oxidoreductase
VLCLASCEQIEYSLIERTVERELIPMAKALNIGVTAWSPLTGGVLTGKYPGHGSSFASPGEPGRMSNDMAKDFMPEPDGAAGKHDALKRHTARGKTVERILQHSGIWFNSFSHRSV